MAHDEEPTETANGSDKLLEHVGVIKGDGAPDITLDVRQWTGADGKVYAPTLRLNRIGQKKGETRLKSLGSIKSAAEAEGLAKLLPKAAKALSTYLAK